MFVQLFKRVVATVAVVVGVGVVAHADTLFLKDAPDELQPHDFSSGGI